VPSLSDSFLFLTLTRLVVVIKFINFRFALFTPPLGDFHNPRQNMESTKYVATHVPFKLGVKPRKAESVTTKMEQLVYDLLHTSLTLRHIGY
jgi:hypothetical protein